MTNEFKNLTDLQALQMEEKAIIAYRQSPLYMPYNDREYLLRRKVELRKECILSWTTLNLVGQFLSVSHLTNLFQSVIIVYVGCSG